MTCRFKLHGLEFVGRKVLLNATRSCRAEVYSVGYGKWSIEIYDSHNNFVKAFVGRNGTRDDVADDLWSEVLEWEHQVFLSYNEWMAPDGCLGSYSFFVREAEKGHLHGLIATL